MNEVKKYDLDEKNVQRLRDILAKALTIACILYTEDEKKKIDKKALLKIIRQSGLIHSYAWEVAHSLGFEILEAGELEEKNS